MEEVEEVVEVVEGGGGGGGGGGGCGRWRAVEREGIELEGAGGGSKMFSQDVSGPAHNSLEIIMRLFSLVFSCLVGKARDLVSRPHVSCPQ